MPGDVCRADLVVEGCGLGGGGFGLDEAGGGGGGRGGLEASVRICRDVADIIGDVCRSCEDVVDALRARRAARGSIVRMQSGGRTVEEGSSYLDIIAKNKMCLDEH